MADLTTLANVAGWLRLPAPSAADTALLTRLITAVSDLVEQWCGRAFLSAAYDEAYDGNGRQVLLLNATPVTAVAALTVDGRAIAPQGAWGQAGYSFSGTAVMLCGYTFGRGRGNVQVAYTAGYATVPASVEQAVIDLVAMRYRELDRIGMASQAVGGETTAYVIRDMPPQVATALATWQRVTPVAPQ